jgi:hypothetical protein
MTKEQDALCVILEASSPEKRGPGYYQAVKVVGDMCEYHAAQLAALQRRGDALADTSESVRECLKANGFVDIGTAVRFNAALAAWRSVPALDDKAKCERCGDTKWIPGVLGIIDGHICPDCATGGGA